MERNPKMSAVGFRPIRSEIAGTNIPKMANPAPNAAIMMLIVPGEKCLKLTRKVGPNILKDITYIIKQLKMTMDNQIFRCLMTSLKLTFSLEAAEEMAAISLIIRIFHRLQNKNS